MNASFRNVLSAAAILTATFATTGQAIAQSRSATFTANYGNAAFGGRVQLQSASTRTVTSTATSRSENVTSRLQARGDVRLNGVFREAAFARFDASANANSTLALRQWLTTQTARNALVVRIGGRTVLSQASTSTNRYAASIAPGNVFGSAGVDGSYGVGPFTLTLNARATAGLSYDATATLGLVPPSVRVAGFARTFANGRASASVGVPGLLVGVSSTLRFANNRVDGNVTASPNGVSGSFTWRTEAVRLFVDLFADVLTARFTLRVVDLALGVSTGGRTLS